MAIVAGLFLFLCVLPIFAACAIFLYNMYMRILRQTSEINNVGDYLQAISPTIFLRLHDWSSFETLCKNLETVLHPWWPAEFNTLSKLGQYSVIKGWGKTRYAKAYEAIKHSKEEHRACLSFILAIESTAFSSSLHSTQLVGLTVGRSALLSCLQGARFWPYRSNLDLVMFRFLPKEFRILIGAERRMYEICDKLILEVKHFREQLPYDPARSPNYDVLGVPPIVVI